MSNSYFQFKQFTVHQERAAMKVSTDACLFGAWVAKQSPPCRKVLDIGTGTGLLSLMYAQQHLEAIVDAIEIESGAARDAAANFAASPWSERLQVQMGAVQQVPSPNEYELVFSNPPFFNNHLQSPHLTRNNARHNTTLSLDELSRIVPALLSADGKFAVLLPFSETDRFVRLMERQHMPINIIVRVKQSPLHRFFRSLLWFSKSDTPICEEEISIRGADNQYSPAFKELLKAYYLYL